MSDEIIKRAAAVIIRNTENGIEILVVEEPSGLLNIPGGGQDPEDNGDLNTTLEREMMEELGLPVDQFTYEDTGIVDRFTYDKDTHPRFGMKAEFYTFIVRLKDTAEPKITDEIKNFKWYKFDEAISSVAHDDVQLMLKQVKEKYKIV